MADAPDDVRPTRSLILLDPTMKTHRLAFLSLLVVALVACGNADTDPSQDTAPAAGEPPAATPAVGAGSTTTMRVVVTGGSKAGTWTKLQTSPNCTMGYADEGAFGVAANELDAGGDGLLGVDIIVPDAANAASGTPDFRFIAYIGGSDTANQLEIHPKKNKGSGTASVERRGRAATVTVRGRTADGVEIDASVECSTVLGG